MPEERIYLEIKVQTRSAENSMEQLKTGEYKVRVRASPVKGEANKAVIKVIADFFNIPRSSVKILRGYKTSRKLVLIEKD